MAILDHNSALDPSGIEEKLEVPESNIEDIQALKLDKRGLPLVPQPSNYKDDPLNWPLWQKYYIVALVSCLTLMAQMGLAMLNPVLVLVAEELHVTVEKASYTTTFYMLFCGVFPLLATPFANVYGRRTVYLLFMVIAIAGFASSAGSPTWGGVITGRVFTVLGCNIFLGIGTTTICDLFIQGERGLPMGIYAWATTNGPHIAPIAGGYIA
jgi:MFS family permease